MALRIKTPGVGLKYKHALIWLLNNPQTGENV